MGENNKDNQLMIIRRTLSPPHENPTEVIYSGKWLNNEEIHKTVDIGPEEARKYYYGISRLELKSNKLTIYDKATDYNEILNPSNMGTFGKSTILTLNNSAKQGLIKLIENSK